MKKLLSLFLAISLLLLFAAGSASADDEWADYTCNEQQFSTKIPVSGSSGYDDEIKGLVIYTGVPGYIPYVIVKRRPMDMKFSNPENYLNNVYREYLEERYKDNNLGMNKATTWEIGGKELLGARYRYKVGETTVVQIQLIEIRPDGDVEYTLKYIEGEEESVFPAANEAVRNYQETDITAQPAETADEDAEVPPFMTPALFADDFNDMMKALADQYAAALGEEGVDIVKSQYILTQVDPSGTLVYYGNPDWTLEAGFMFEHEADYYLDMPALLLNFNIKNGTPDGAVFLAQTALKFVIAYHYQNEVSLDDLTAWFKEAPDSANVFQLPGYTLNVLQTNEYLQYAILPPDDKNPYAPQ